ncbi:MAG: GtrA family protein [Myxococcales bacterium]|nr:GtrA family protein [Myxococcales bacterium]
MDEPATTDAPPTTLRARLIDHLGRIGRSGLIGIVCVTIDLVVLYVLTKLAGFEPWIAKVFSFSTATIVQFLGNREFTFRASEGKISRQAVYYAIVEVAAFGLNIASFHFLRRAQPASWPLWLPAIVAGAISFWLFTYPIWHWVFKLTPEEAERTAARKAEAEKPKSDTETVSGGAQPRP